MSFPKDARQWHCWGSNLQHLHLKTRTLPMGRSRGGTGGPTPSPPLEKSQKYRVSLKYWSGSPEKTQSYPRQHSMLVHHLPASKMPFQWRLAGGPMMAQLKRYLDLLSPHQLKKSYQIWTLSDRTFWIRGMLIHCATALPIQVWHNF